MRHLCCLVSLVITLGACSGSDPVSTPVPLEPTATETTSPTPSVDPTATPPPTATAVPLDIDVPPICSVVSLSEMADVLGNEVESSSGTISDESSFAADCFYTHVGDGVEDLDSQVSVAITADGCVEALPSLGTEGDAEVTAVPEYGDQARLTTSPAASELAVCRDGRLLEAIVSGPDGVTSDTRLAAATAVLDLLIARL